MSSENRAVIDLSHIASVSRIPELYATFLSAAAAIAKLDTRADDYESRLDKLQAVRDDIALRLLASPTDDTIDVVTQLTVIQSYVSGPAATGVATVIQNMYRI